MDLNFFRRRERGTNELKTLTVDEIAAMKESMIVANEGETEFTGIDADNFVLIPAMDHRETIAAPDPFSVTHHIDNIKSILASVQNRRESLIETGKIEREDFDRREAERAAMIADLDRLTATYEAALAVSSADIVSAVPFPQGVVAEVKNGSVRFTKPRRRKPVEPVTE